MTIDLGCTLESEQRVLNDGTGDNYERKTSAAERDNNTGAKLYVQKNKKQTCSAIISMGASDFACLLCAALVTLLVEAELLLAHGDKKIQAVHGSALYLCADFRIHVQRPYLFSQRHDFHSR